MRYNSQNHHTRHYLSGLVVLVALALFGDYASVRAAPDGMVKCDDNKAFGRTIVYTEDNPMPFCANNGLCRDDWEENPQQPCECRPGFGGPHCELPSNKVPTCTMPCENGGVCMVGATSWEQLLQGSDYNLQRQYCMCKDGYHGLYCEHPAEPCGEDNFCYNGGTCVSIDRTNGDGTISTSYHCDCTTAGDTKRAFAGEYCEYPASTMCSNDIDHNGRHFCVNGGMCNDESHKGCMCNEGFVGPVCEFVSLDREPPKCNLQCFNHGICRKGAKNLAVLRKFGISNRRHLQAFNEDFEHCVCPAGYAGLQCEYQIDVCPGADHICLNGGRCGPFMDGDRLQFICDCARARTARDRFAGLYCEMISTQFCTTDHQRTNQGRGQDAFCTNDGKCKALVEQGQQHPGCECESGYFGDQCQYVGSATNFVRIKQVDNQQKGLVGALTIIMILLSFSIMYFIYSRKREFSCSPFNSVFDTAPAPTLDNLEAVDPWNSCIFEEESTGSDNELFDDVDLNEDKGSKFVGRQADEDSAAEFDTTYSFDGSICDSQSQGDITPVLGSKRKLGTMTSTEGPVMLLRTGNGLITIDSSLDSEPLHVFNDSHDGSECDKSIV